MANMMTNDERDARKLTDLSDKEIEELPVDRLGLVVLRHIVDAHEWNINSFILGRGQSGGTQKPALRCLAEAMNWLVSKNLVACPADVHDSPFSIFVTRRGSLVLDEGLDLLLAGERLDMKLHPLIEKVQSQFLLGEYELAAFAAMKEVEIRVRKLSKADTSLLGVDLMHQAFKEGGNLADPNLVPGERVAVMGLFASSIGVFKNPPSHRQVDYDDPTEASEVVLLADLLMRMLDRIETRLGD